MYYTFDSQTFEPHLTKVFNLLKERNKTLATAESCTAGLLSFLLTMKPGSSRIFPGGIVAYSNDCKVNLLGIPNDLLRREGAVSKEVAKCMAASARTTLGANYGVGITGIAGPDGGSREKPVGTVWLGFAGPGKLSAKCLKLTDSRDMVRQDSALQSLLYIIENLIED